MEAKVRRAGAAGAVAALVDVAVTAFIRALARAVEEPVVGTQRERRRR